MKTHNLTSDGSTDAFLLNSRRAIYTVKLSGTFGGATVELQVRENPEADWITIPDAAFTAGTIQILELANMEVRWKVSSSSGTTDIDTLINPHLPF